MDSGLIITMIIIIQTCTQTTNSVISSRCECLTYSKTFGKEFGTFNSPDYPHPYPTMIDCLLYTFVADTNEIVEITIKDFNVYKASHGCLDEDYVKVYAHVEGGKINEYTEWDSILCGRYPDVPHFLYSSVSALVLQFHSGNKSTNATGFIGTFRFLDKRIYETDGRQLRGTVCDQQFESGNSSQQGRFYSPRYPASYPRSIHCSYSFKARPDEIVKVTFEELALQKGDESCLNRKDVVRIYDGYSSLNTNILTLCNEMNMVEVFSSGFNLHVEFLAQDRYPGQGFKALYYFLPINELNNLNELQQADFRKNYRGSFNSNSERTLELNKYPGNPVTYPLTRSSCDVNIHSIESSNGSISSPLYPKPYPGSSRCLFVFQAKGRERVVITFDDLNLYYNNKEPKVCSGTDSIVIYGKMEGRMEKITTICGTDKTLPIMSSGPTLALEFLGIYSSSSSRGFRASYYFVENYGIQNGEQLTNMACGFRFNSNNTILTNEFSSPNFPGLYPRNTECHYLFYAKAKEKIKISFTYFELEGVLPCDEHSESDYVEFSNYIAHDKNFARHCGNLSRFSVSSIGNFFRVTFRSNAVLDGSGFHATFAFINETSVRPTAKQPNIAQCVPKPQDFFLLSFCILIIVVNVGFV